LAKVSATDYDTTWVDQSGGGGGALTISNKTAAYTVVAGDLGTIINCTANTFTVSLTAAATLGSGFNCWVWNTSATTTDVITIDLNGAETIDGLSTLILRRGEGMQIVCDGTNWQTGDKKVMRGYAENFANSVTRPVASANSSVAISANAVAGVSNSTAIGRDSSGNGATTANNSGAMALGGSYASGSNSFAAAISNNSGSYGSTGGNAIAIGRISISSNTSSLALGDTSTASGDQAIAIGTLAVASASDSVAIGLRSASLITGKYAYANGGFIGSGSSQTGVIVLRKATTDATPTVLTSDNNASGTTNQVILPNNSAYAFSGIIVARQKAADGTASAAWKVEGLIRREANAASTTLVVSTVTAIDNTPGWTLALSADTTNGGLKVEATGAAATNIRFVATIQTSEVTYA
jgi:hypothetical protein